MIRFKQFMTEHVLSIGLNSNHEKYREQHRQEIHHMLKKSYEKVGGYSGEKPGSKEESDKIHHDISHSVIKATRRNGKITSVNLYKKQHGRKSIASATDGTEHGKNDWKKTKLEDHEQKKAWGEVSGAVEHLQRKMGVPVVHNNLAGKLLNKDVEKHEDGERYTRQIGREKHTKVIMGHPKLDN